jgi:hypothetical protein
MYVLQFTLGFFAGMAIWIYAISPELSGLLAVFLGIALLARIFPLFTAFLFGIWLGLFR